MRLLRRRRWLLAVLVVVAGLAVLPLCRWSRRPGVRVISAGHSEAPLQAGAGSAPLTVPLPVVAAGYGTARPEVSGRAAPLEARALVLESGTERVGLLTLDLLLVDGALVEEVRHAAAALRLSTLWVAATHTHSSLGAYASNPVVQVAGTGRFRPQVRQGVVAAAVGALSEAAGRLAPVTAFAGTSPRAGRTASRDEFPEVDVRLTRLVLRGAAGPVGQVVVFAAHPTLAEHPALALDPDWPGRLALAEEARGQGVTLVLQGSGGNATATRPPEGEAPVESVAGFVGAALDVVPLRAVGTGLGHASAEVRLPGADATRLVPRGLATAVENVLLCPWAPRTAEVSVLEIGSLRFLALPAEATFAAGLPLERAAGGARLVSLVNGYLGYVESPERVEGGRGESPRQLFSPALLEALRQGAAAAGGARATGP